MKTDLLILLIIHIPIVVFLGATFASIQKEKRAKKSHNYAGATVKRGDKSMSILWALYGVSTVCYSLAASTSPNLKEFTPGVIILDYIALTYLFFYSSWFRNSVVFKYTTKINED